MRGCIVSRGGKRDREAREARAEGEGAFERAGGAPLAAVELEVGVVEATMIENVKATMIILINQKARRPTLW